MQAGGDDALANAMLDQQHRHLLVVVNLIREAATNTETRTTDILLEYLHRFLQLHFETEERLLESRRQPELSAHVAEHAHYMQAVRLHVEHLRDLGKINLSDLSALADSLYEHEVRADEVFRETHRNPEG